jgi:hypothetical protein
MMLAMRYVKLAVVGTIVGIVALSTWAVLPDIDTAFLPYGLPFSREDLVIPAWDQITTGYDCHTYTNFEPGQLLNLEHEAIALRLAALLCNFGFWFFAVPISVACGYAELKRRGTRNDLIRAGTESIEALFASILIACTAWSIASSSSGCLYTPTALPQNFEQLMIEAWGSVVHYFGYALLSGISVFLWLTVLLVLIIRKQTTLSWIMVIVYATGTLIPAPWVDTWLDTDGSFLTMGFNLPWSVFVRFLLCSLFGLGLVAVALTAHALRLASIPKKPAQVH